MGKPVAGKAIGIACAAHIAGLFAGLLLVKNFLPAKNTTTGAYLWCYYSC
jgi:membrane associated rhomboid family serine protease